MRNRYARERIKLALLDLMAEKPFEKVSIVDITKRAEVSRATYYHYYYEQREVLEDAIDDLVGELMEAFAALETASPESFRASTAAVNDRIYENRTELKTVLSSPVAAPLIERRYRETCSAYCEGLAQHLSLGDTSFHNQMFDYIFDGYWGMLKGWVLEDCATPKDEFLERSWAVSERMMRMAGVE